MFENSNLISLLFNFINLGVIIAACVYFYKRSFQQSLQKSIAQEHGQQNDLHTTIAGLKTHYNNIALAINQEASLIDHLSNKIELWRAYSKTQEDTHQEEYNRLVAEQRNRVMQQSAHLKQELVIQEASRQAIQKVKNKLTHTYKNSVMQQKYLDAVAAVLAQRGI